MDDITVRALPATIGQLSSLVMWSMRDCIRLEALPPEIGHLRALRHLYLDGCTSLKTLPREIAELTVLAYLYLDGTGLENPPPTVWRCGTWMPGGRADVAAIRNYIRAKKPPKSATQRKAL